MTRLNEIIRDFFDVSEREMSLQKKGYKDYADYWLKKCFCEKSLQHELGEYIEKKLNNNGFKYIIQFERNLNYFSNLTGFENKKKPTKKAEGEKSEIDIVVLENDEPKKLRNKASPYAMIEIKYIRQFKQDLSSRLASPTKSLYGGLCDIQFVKECHNLGFSESYALFVTDHNSIYDANLQLRENQDVIWTFYRQQGASVQDVRKYGGKGKNINIFNVDYKIDWQDVMDYEDEMCNKLHLKYNLFSISAEKRNNKNILEK